LEGILVAVEERIWGRALSDNEAEGEKEDEER